MTLMRFGGSFVIQKNENKKFKSPMRKERVSRPQPLCVRKSCSNVADLQS
jgi:hypothetical protein